MSGIDKVLTHGGRYPVLQPYFRRGIFQEERTLTDVLAQGGERPVAGLGHDGAFGHAGAGAQRVAGVVAGDAGFRNQLFDHQGYGLGSHQQWNQNVR
jgi:hypothetical protein